MLKRFAKSGAGKRLILFFVRKRLGLKNYETFQFVNQRSKSEYYWFNQHALRKYIPDSGEVQDAHVGLNWLLSEKCKIKPFDPVTFFPFGDD